MKAIKLFALAVALAFAATMAITPNASAASTGSRSSMVTLKGQQPATPQQAQPSAQDQQAQQAQTFTGTIKNANGEYVLYVPASRTAYKLNDQAKAKQFEGQTVTVKGTLDASTNMITVSDIQPASTQ